MRQNISDDSLLESIISKIRKENDGDDLGAADELDCGLNDISDAYGIEDRSDIGTSLYWLLDDETKDRLRSFSHDRFTYTSLPWTAQCKYMASDFLGVTAGFISDAEHRFVLTSKANPNISVELDDPRSVKCIASAYNRLMNEVMDFYGELKEMQFAYGYMKSLIGLLKEKNPDADWEHFSPSRLIEEIKKNI